MTDDLAARILNADAGTDIRAELIRSRRPPEPVKMIREDDHLVALEAAQDDARTKMQNLQQASDERVLLSEAFNAVTAGHPVEQVVSGMLQNGVPPATTQRLLDALSEVPLYASDAAQLSEQVGLMSANATLSFEGARLTADAEDQRLAAVKEDARFQAIQSALDPEVAMKTQAIRDQHIAAELPPPPPLLTAGIAVVDTVAQRNAKFKQDIMGAFPDRALSRGNTNVVGETAYTADLEREREHVIDRARIVPADPRVRANIEKLVYSAPSPVNEEMRRASAVAAKRQADDGQTPGRLFR